MERKYLNDLIAWLNDDLRKPLIVYGARQVGKTTLIRDIFAKEHFKGNYIYIDCKKNLDFADFCYNHIDPKEIIDYLSLKENKVIDKNSNNTLSGIFYENYVASELTIGGYKLFYWKGKNNAEFEFIIEYGSNIIPIEVKKSKGTLSSLEKFKNHNKLFVAIKISENYFGFNEENKILTILFYYVSFFINALKDNSLEKLIKS